MSSSGHRKSSVAQTCNLLSQYLKENGRLGDITGLGLTANFEADKGVNKFTMNLLQSLESSAESSKQDVVASSSSSSFACSNSTNDYMEIGTSPMTIFYNGEVLVFNDFSTENAKEIMALANQFGSSNNTSNAVAEKIIPRRAVTPDLNMASTSEHNTDNIIATPDRFCQLSQARRVSLHRFLEKRKARATARAPYKVNNSSSSSSSMAAPFNKPEYQSKYPWLELEGQSSEQLILKL